MNADMSAKRMKRDECFRVLARHVGDAIVVAAYSSAVEWEGIAPRVLNYYSVGAMGLSASHGLGLALAYPARRVIVLDGDGSLLMNLGCLVTVGAAAPRNLVHLVCNNGCYEANGSQPIPNPDVDFSAMARAAGYAATFDFSDLDAFTQQAGHVLGESGPVFATLHVERTQQLKYDYRALYAAEKRSALKAELQAG
jgi:sulfopyruvate decarboxylase subunit beta